MAGTATRYKVDEIRIGTPVLVWYNVAVPGAGARMTLHTDGTPDATANPSAKHLGMTTDGTVIKVTWAITDHYADDFAEPIKSSVEQVAGSITGNFMQVFDEEVLQAVTSAVGTYATASGYEELSFGRKALTYVPVAVIYPTEADPTKFAVFHLYKAMNVASFELGVSRKTMSSIPFEFKGYAIPTRAATDTLGKWWQQIA